MKKPSSDSGICQEESLTENWPINRQCPINLGRGRVQPAGGVPMRRIASPRVPVLVVGNGGQQPGDGTS